MADRITNQEINVRVAYIARKLNRPASGIGSISVDSYSPGNNPYQYKLAELMENGGVHEWTSYRMTRKEFYAYLNGICAGIDANQGDIVKQNLLYALQTITEHAREAYPHFESERGQADIKQALDAIQEATR